MRSKIMISLVLILLLIIPQGVSLAEEGSSEDQTFKTVVEARYHTVLGMWKETGVGSASKFEAPISPPNFVDIDQKDLLSADESKGYGDRVFYWHNQKSFTYEVTVPEDGLYELSFDYYPLSKEVIPIEGSILVNGEFPYYESRRIVFPIKWKHIQDKFDVDRFGNEIIPKQVAITEWSKVTAEDASHLQADPLKFHLKKGSNEITLSNLRGEMLVGNVYVHSPSELLPYKNYLKQFSNIEKTKVLITQEAETGYTKSSSYTRPVATVGSSVIPNDTKKLLLNTLGGESWSESGQRVNWMVTVEEEGYYQLTFKVLQNKETGGTVFRKLRINGEIPFAEAAQLPFEFNKKWTNSTLENQEGEPFLFYLTKGENEISLEADASPVERTINKVTEVIQDMQEFSLSIKKLTGNQSDRSREWKISEYIPDVQERLAGWADQLEEEGRYVTNLNNGKESKDIVSLNLAVKKLRTLHEKPDEIPKRLTELTEGSSSVAQLLGNLLSELPKQPLLVDRFYVHGTTKLPESTVGFWTSAKDSMKRFVQSFSAG